MDYQEAGRLRRQQNQEADDPRRKQGMAAE